MMMKTSFLLLSFLLISNIQWAQNFVFGQLTGSPNMITTGWNLTGNAHIGDTPGDADAFSNELILTNNSQTQSGGVFYNTPINLNACQTWTVEFQYRIWDGDAADGLAFCFIDVSPIDFVNGSGLGIPANANGLKIVIDTYDNCNQGGTNPEIQIFNGMGYSECIPATTPKIQNSGVSLNYLRSTNYQPVKITYNNGLVTVFVNNVQLLQANSPVNFTGYVGFTASTGWNYDLHSIRNVTIYTDQAVSNAGVDVSTCSNEGVSIGTTPNALNLYSWSPAIGLSSTTSANPTVTIPNTTGAPIIQTYTVTTSLASNPGLCPTTDQINVTVFPEFNSTASQTVCEGIPFVVNGQSITQAGNYNFSLSSIHGCDSLVDMNVVFTPIPQFNLEDTTICIGNILTIAPDNPGGSYSYSWTPQMAPTSATGAMTWNPTISNEFFLLATNNDGCTHLDSLDLTVNPLPNMGLVPSAQALCPNESLTLTASGAATYSWSGPGVANISGNIQSIIPTGTGTFQAIGYTAAGCVDSIQTSFTLYPKPIITLTPDQEICLGKMASMTVIGADTYSWDPSNLIGSQVYVSPSVTSTYEVIGFNQFNCSDTAISIVTVHPNPVALIGADPYFLTSDSPLVTFSNLSTGQVVSTWDFDDGTVLQELSTPFEYQFPFEEGNYNVSLLVESQYGCLDSSTQLIQVKGDVIYYVPNSFTPDGDEHNNMFTPVFTSGFDPLSYQLDIYDRWGELLFTSQNPQIGWDGYLNFVKCQEGMYAYNIRFIETKSGEYKSISGHVNLLK
jgi:gliding motility-associated-like protein